MTFKVISIKTKPDGVLFWNQVSDENNQSSLEFNAWVETVPGFISRINEDIDENTKKITTVWDSEESYLNFQENKISQKQKMYSKEYNNLNGISSTNTIENNS